MLEQKLRRYEYPIKGKGKTESYTGSYTIKAGVKPLGFKGEHLVQEITMVVLAPEERLNEHEEW